MNPSPTAHLLALSPLAFLRAVTACGDATTSGATGRWLSRKRTIQALTCVALLATLLPFAGCGSSGGGGGGSNPRVADCSSTPVFSCVLPSRDSSTCREVFSAEAADGLRAQCKDARGEMRDAGCDAKFDVCCQDNGAPGGYPQRACLYSIREDVYESFRESCGGELCR